MQKTSRSELDPSPHSVSNPFFLIPRTTFPIKTSGKLIQRVRFTDGSQTSKMMQIVSAYLTDVAYRAKISSTLIKQIVR